MRRGGIVDFISTRPLFCDAQAVTPIAFGARGARVIHCGSLRQSGRMLMKLEALRVS
jgi:hypothetical protein